MALKHADNRAIITGYFALPRQFSFVTTFSSVFLLCLFCISPASAQLGVEYLGRWAELDNAKVATWPGSGVALHFKNSSFVSADLGILGTEGKAKDKIYISVSTDGGKPIRIGLDGSPHPASKLALGLSPGEHVVIVHNDSEPFHGALTFTKPVLEPGGEWLTIVDRRPVIEIVDDSDATGVCLLGPRNPSTHVNLGNPDWASYSLSFPALVEEKLAQSGYPAEVVDLSISGSTVASEATAYDQATPLLNESRFIGYSQHRTVSVALLWGGSNDHNQGGDLATGAPVTLENLSVFQRGVYDQITKVVSRNPNAKIGLLWYVDPNVRSWKTAYVELLRVLPGNLQKQIIILDIDDIPNAMDACDIAPSGHPDSSQHEHWANQIAAWLISQHLLPSPGVNR